MSDRSVIHDLGYRHYDGTRLARRTIARSLMWETLRGVFGLGRPARAKVMPWVLIGILMTPVIAAAAAAFLLGQVSELTGQGGLLMEYRAFPITMQFFLSLFIAGRAPYAISRDLRDGVMPLYFSRPIERSDYVWAKLGGVGLGVFLVLAVPQALLFVVALLAELPVAEHLVAFLAGLAVSALMAAVTTAIGLAIASSTTARGRGIAAIMAYFVMVNVLAAISSEVLASRGSQAAGDYIAGLSPITAVNGVGMTLLGGTDSSGLPYPDSTVGGLVFLAALGVTFAACVAFLMRRYRKAGGL